MSVCVFRHLFQVCVCCVFAGVPVWGRCVQGSPSAPSVVPEPGPWTPPWCPLWRSGPEAPAPPEQQDEKKQSCNSYLLVVTCSEDGWQHAGRYLQLQVLAPVVPLEQNTALSFALVEALQGRLVLLHLHHHLWAQLHHGLVVTDGQDQHVVRSQAAFSHGQVTLQSEPVLFTVFLFSTTLCWLTICGYKLTCDPILMTRCFSTWGLARQNQQGPVGWAAHSERTTTHSVSLLSWFKIHQLDLWTKTSGPVKTDAGSVFPGWTHGACGAVWVVPGKARLCAAGLVLVLLRPNISSCRRREDRRRRRACCWGRRRTDQPAPEQTTKRTESLKSSVNHFLNLSDFSGIEKLNYRPKVSSLKPYDTIFTSSVSRPVLCLSVLSFAELLYGFSVTSCGCFTSSEGSMFFMGIMLKAYKYCSEQTETDSRLKIFVTSETKSRKIYSNF